MFGNEIMIGSLRAQANRLKQIVSQLELDTTCKENLSYYAKEIHNIERALRMMRKNDFEQPDLYTTSQKRPH